MEIKVVVISIPQISGSRSGSARIVDRTEESLNILGGTTPEPSPCGRLVSIRKNSKSSELENILNRASKALDTLDRTTAQRANGRLLISKSPAKSKRIADIEKINNKLAALASIVPEESTGKFVKV